MDWLNIVISILSGLAVCIPLAIKLVQYVESSIKSKNWDKLINLVMDNMSKAEQMFSTGAERKKWVMSLLESNANSVNYELSPEDVQKISDMIDTICSLAKDLTSETKYNAGNT